MVKPRARLLSTMSLAVWVLLGCGRKADPPKATPAPSAPPVPTGETSAPVAHSTLADTTGMNADLRIIERKLGPLPPGIRDQLVAVEVSYFSFMDSSCSAVDLRAPHTGVLVVHSCVAEDVRTLFETLKRDTFPIAKVVPINRYGLNADSTGWNDAASMADNNTSAFNYRTKPRSPEPSKHTQGIAIDINPRQNPMVRHDISGTSIEPARGHYDTRRPGTLDRMNTSRLLTPIGWSWGGRWPRPQDHQHIEKSRGNCAHLTYSLK